MMSELAIHEPRSFKVCIELVQLWIKNKKVRKGERKAGGSKETGRQHRDRRKRREGGKKAGRHAGIG